MKKKKYKLVPKLNTEQEYADFWNTVSYASEYLDPKRFKNVSPSEVLPIVPSFEFQIRQVRKFAKKTGTESRIVLYRLLKAGAKQLPEFKSLL